MSAIILPSISSSNETIGAAAAAAVVTNISSTTTTSSNSAPTDNNWWALIVLVLVFATATGNILVCLAITWEKRLQNVTNYFLMSLAITDLMVAILVMPLGILTLFKGYFPFDSLHCLIWICFDVLFCTASIMHLCTISVDRYLSLRYPMKFGRNKTRKRVILKIIFVWLLSIAMSLPLCLMYSGNRESILIDGLCQIPDPLYKLIGSIVCFYVPLLVMLVTYMLTVRLLARQQKNLEGLKKSKKNHFRFASRKLRRDKGSVMSTPESIHVSNGGTGTGSLRRKCHTKFWSLANFERRKRLNNQISITTETDMTVNLEVPLTQSSQLNNTSTATNAAAATTTVISTNNGTNATNTATPTINSVNSSGCGSIRRPLLKRTIAATNASSCSSFDQPTSTVDESLTLSNDNSDDQEEDDEEEEEDEEAEDGEEKATGVKEYKKKTRGRRKCFDHAGTQLWLDDYQDEDDDDEDDEEEDENGENNSAIVMSALQQFGAQMLTLSRGLQSLNSCESIKTCLDKVTEQPLDSNIIPGKKALLPVPNQNNCSVTEKSDVIETTETEEEPPKEQEPEEIELKTLKSPTPRKSQLLVTINEPTINPLSLLEQRPCQQFVTSLKRPRSQKSRNATGTTLTTTRSVTDPNKTSTRHGRIILLEQKATKVLGMVFFSFVILWAPFFVLNLLPILCGQCEQQLNHMVFDLATWLGYASSMINPILYTIFNQTFRKTFLNLLKWQYCRRKTKFSVGRDLTMYRQQRKNHFLINRSRMDFQKIV